jgi:GNAT superfamily N-acetyltransferase
MTGKPVEVHPTIDREWLERAAAADPVTHAFALWDFDRNPGRIRFFSAVRDGETLGYLLVWLGHPAAAVVHWFGSDPAAHALANSLPVRPAVAIVPEAVVETVEAARGPARRFSVFVLAHAVGAPPAAPTAPTEVRRLTRADVPTLATWARRQTDPVTAEYPFLDPEVELTWGAFYGGRLVGVARAEVRLPRVWILGGVYVEEEARGQGRGRALVGEVLRAAGHEGARVALYVREDRVAARTLYEGLGFHPVDRRVWLDLGAGLAP